MNLAPEIQMIPAHSGGLLAAEVVKAVREGDIDAVRSWLAAGGDEFVNEPALYEYRRPLDRRLCRTIEKLVVLEGPRVLALRARRLIATGLGKVYKISHGIAKATK